MNNLKDVLLYTNDLEKDKKELLEDVFDIQEISKITKNERVINFFNDFNNILRKLPLEKKIIYIAYFLELLKEEQNRRGGNDA